MLTVRAIEAAKPREKGYKLTDGAGLYLYITPSGSKSWRANTKLDGKQITKTYGLWPDVSLADARRAHAQAPEKKKELPTFESVAKDWLKIKLPTLSNGKHQIQVQNTLERFAYPKIGNRPIDTISRKDLVSLVQAVQSEGVIETAHRVAGRINAVFDYAQDLGLLESHPAANLVRVLQSRKTKKPMASIDPKEAPALFVSIQDYDEPVTRLGLQLLAHTFVRVGEIRWMRWSELREEGAVWLVPGERMKLRLPHVVPLSTQARAILEELKSINGDNELVLQSPLKRSALSENTFLFALYRLGYRGKMTAHGFRSLASSVLNESGFDRDVIERQLAHKETDAVRAAYNRAEYLPQRREMMQWWGDWVQRASRQLSK
jgi:integrase